MTNPISEERAAIAARERRDGVLDALACALMDADRIHQPGACGCRLSRTARYCPRCGAEADRGPEAAMAGRRDRELLEKYRRRMRGDWT